MSSLQKWQLFCISDYFLFSGNPLMFSLLGFIAMNRKFLDHTPWFWMVIKAGMSWRHKRGSHLSFFKTFFILGKSQSRFEYCPPISPWSAKTKHLNCIPWDAVIPGSFSRIVPSNVRTREAVLPSYKDLIVQVYSSSDLLCHLKKITSVLWVTIFPLTFCLCCLFQM